MSDTIEFRSAYEPTDFVKQVYEIQNNRLKMWRNRYSKEEYIYKVALNTAYQTLTCKSMWGEILNSFKGKMEFKDFNESFNYIQKKSGYIATTKIIHSLESDYLKLSTISILSLNTLRKMVADAQNCNNEKVSEVERTYIWYTGAVESIYGWAALGLLGMNMGDAILKLCGILLGGNYSDLDVAFRYFGMKVEACNDPLPDLW